MYAETTSVGKWLSSIWWWWFWLGSTPSLSTSAMISSHCTEGCSSKRWPMSLTVPELKKRSLKTVGIHPIWDDDDGGGKSSLSPPKRHRCMACMNETGIRRLTKIKWLYCKKSICLSHVNYVCNECKIVNVSTSYKAPGSCKSEVNWIQLYLLTVSDWFLNFCKSIYL